MGLLGKFRTAAKRQRLARRRIVSSVRETFYRWSLGQPHQECHTLPCISFHGDFSLLPECSFVKEAFDRALADIGGPPDCIRAIHGMSGQMYRTFINNLISLTPDARYLEIGSWKGSTATAALYGNTVRAVCIDNWSQFGDARTDFFTNIERVRSPTIDLRFVEMDFRRVDYRALGRFNIFLFDGPHKERDQYDGIMLARPALADSFVLIVDDWNWRRVRLGTLRALKDAGFSVASAIEVRTTRDDSHMGSETGDSDWHNGYLIAALRSTN